MFKDRAKSWGALILTLLLLGCGQEAESETDYFSSAKEYLAQGKLNQAEIELKNTLKANPDNPEARYLLGEIYLEKRSDASAEKELRRAMALGVASDKVMLPLSRALLNQGNFDEVLALAQPAEGHSAADNAEIHRLRGLALLGQGQLEPAGEALAAALQRDPESAEVWVALAHHAIALRQFKEAREHINEALALRPSMAEAWGLLGDIESMQGHPDRAEEAYGDAINNSDYQRHVYYLKRGFVRLAMGDEEGASEDIANLKASEHPKVNYLQGLIAFHQKQYQDAQRAFEKTLAMAPEDMSAILALGTVHYVQKHHQQAETYLRRFLQAHPDADHVAKLLAATLITNHAYAEAESVLKPIVARQPEDVLALNLLANASVLQGKTSEGIEYLQQVTRLDPDSASAQMKLGVGLLMGGDADSASQTLETSLALDSSLQQAEILLALQQISQQEYDKAITIAEKMHQADPASPVALNLLGMAYLGKKETDKSIAAFSQALERNPGDTSAGNNLAKIYLQNGEPEKARLQLEEVLEHHPDDMLTLLTIARIEANQGQHQQAGAHLEHAVSLDPGGLLPRLLLANYRYQLREFQDAQENLEAIRHRYPDHQDVLRLWGRVQLALDHPEAAAKAFAKLVAMQPKSAQDHQLLAKAYLGMQDLDKSTAHLTRSLELEPRQWEARAALVENLVLAKRLDSAEQQLQQLQQDYPDKPELLLLRGWVAAQQQRYSQAIDVYRQALEVVPSTSLVNSLADAQWRSGDPDASVATMTQWLQAHPDDLVVQKNLANAYLLLNRMELAIPLFESIVAQRPDHVEALNSLAWLLRMEDPDRALSYAERSYKLAPDTPAVIDTLGVVLMHQGLHERALEMLHKANKKSPDNLNIQYHMAQALVRNDKKLLARNLLDDIMGKETPFYEKDQAQQLLEELNNELNP